MSTALSSIITVDEYYGAGQWLTHPDVTEEAMADSLVLIDKVNTVLQLAINDGVRLEVNPITGSYVSGKFHGLGGFRPRDATQGATLWSHKEGKGVDIYDLNRDLCNWCMTHQNVLAAHGLYMEHPKDTPSWCHLTTRPPKSGKTVFRLR